MKKNDWIFLVSVLIYSILFWKQMPGLNALLFTGILLFGQILMNREIVRNPLWILAGVGAIASSFCVLNYGNTLSIFATFFSLLLTSYFAYEKKGSVLIGIFSSFISICASIGFMISTLVENRMNKAETQKGNRSWKKIIIVLFAMTVTLIFFFMYRESSLMFYNLTQKINLDFISFPWICFTALGALVVYGFYFHHSIPGVAEWDRSHALKLSPAKEETWVDKLMSMDSEQFSGIVLFSLLNLLLLVVNGLDAAFIFGGNGKLPQGVSCMQYVHQGVGMLITSIIFAMLIILYYFRGRMNFSANGKWLRTLAVIWIVQNAFMLFSTFWRNDVYIMVFGLTYKRIGVFVYLLLTLIGLFVTAWKVYGKKTNAFLIRTNSWLFYGVWIIACFVNWDKIIFNNNVSLYQAPDLVYLNSLSDNILPELVHYTQKKRYAGISNGVNEDLSARVYIFLNKQKWLRDEAKWPSYQLKADLNYNELKDESNLTTDSNLVVRRKEIKHIYFFRGFENLKSLDLSQNDLVDVGEISQFKNLEVLDISNNPKLTSLHGIENADHIEYLYMNGTSVDDISPILKMKNLKIVVLNYMKPDWADQIHAAKPNFEIKTEN